MASAALVAALAVAGCQVDGTLPTNSKAMAPLSPRLVADMNQKNMDKESPILIRIFKQESELEIWKQDRDGRFALLKTYPICRWSGELGPKIREGDRQAPEGFYKITPGQMNPNSAYYLSFDLGYPNAFDRAHGRTGAQLMVHGDCSSRGCYSMTDEQVAEIYALGREAFFGGQKSFQVQAYPFRMTPENMAKHRNNPHMAFWKMLKKGNDHFEVTRLEPKVDVCDKHYVFDAENPADPNRPLSFSPAGKCPAYSVPADVTAAVLEKQRRDEVQTAELTRQGTPVAPVRTYTDGGMHPVFAAAVRRNELGNAPTALSTQPLPGTIPATVRPPRAPEVVEHPDYGVNSPGPVLASMEQPLGSATPDTPDQTPKAKTTANMFTSLFTSSGEQVAKWIGLKNDEKPKPAAAVTPPPKKVATKPAHSPGAIRPKPAAEPKPVANADVAKPAPAAPAAPVAPAAPAAATPKATTAPNNTLAGAAPTVPAGTFDTRWQAFR